MFRDERGITLLELLVALIITVLLGATLATIFRTGMDAWQRGEATTQRCQPAREALELMSKDIRSAVLLTEWKKFSGKDVRFFGENDVNSYGDKLHFISLANQPGVGESDFGKIGYYIAQSGGVDYLYRHWQVGNVPDDNITAHNGASTAIALHVKELNFSYWDGATKLTAWNSDTALPDKVWIGLTVQDDRPQIKKREVISTIVYLPSR